MESFSPYSLTSFFAPTIVPGLRKLFFFLILYSSAHSANFFIVKHAFGGQKNVVSIAKKVIMVSGHCYSFSTEGKY